MADRVVKVRYEALVDGAIANTKRLGAATKDYATRSAQHVRDNEAAMSRMTTGLAVGATAVGVGVGVMTKQWMGFDQQMSGVRAVAGATSEEMARLEKAAIDLGASTIFSASEVASAQAELVRAGVGVEDMLSGGLQGALDLAAAGGLELADASIIAAQAMNLFNLEGKDVPRVADVLASAANKSAADVSDLGQAMQQAGTVASQTGLSLEETAAALAMFADQGIRGSDAGTSLKTMLQRLTPQSKEAQRVFDELGFSAYDAQGNFIGLEALAGELQDSFGGLDTESRNMALGLAFGSDSVRGASILMEGGATAAREYETAMHDTGAASRMASEMTDNLAGDLEELGGAFETLLIQGGKRGDGFLRGVTQGLTGLVDIAATSPGWLQDATLALGGLVTVGGLGAAGVLKMGTSLVSFGDDLASVAGKSTRMSTAVSGLGGFLAGPWGIALAAGVGALSLFAIEQGKARVEADELRQTLDEQTGAITQNTREWWAKNLQDRGVFETYEKMGGNVRDLTAALEDDEGARRRIISTVEKHSAATERAASSTGGLGVNLSESKTAAALFMQQLDSLGVLTDEQAEKQRQMNEATAVGGRSAEALAAETGRLTAQAEAYLASQEGAVDTTVRWTSAMEEAEALGEDAAAAYQEWATEMAGFSGSFVSMSDALSTVNTATQEWAQEQADATDTAEDSWEDFWDGQSLDVDAYIAELARMVEAQSAWEHNMVLLSGQVSQGVLDELARMGPEGAVLAQAMVDDTTGVLKGQMEAAFGDEARAGTRAFTDAMADSGPILRAAAYRWGQDIADEIAGRLASGEATAAEIVEEYDLAATIHLLSDATGFNTGLDASLTLGNESTATAHLDGEDSGWRRALDTSMALGNDSSATADLKGDPDELLLRLRESLAKVNDSDATVDILGWDGLARRTHRAFLEAVDDSDGTVDVYVDDDPARRAMDLFFRAYDNVKIALSVLPGFNFAAGGIIERANGGLDQAGRHVPRQPMMGGPAYGRTNILWGEPETGWEGYISGKPGMERRNVEVWRESGRRLPQHMIAPVLAEEARRMGMTILDGLGVARPFAWGGMTGTYTATLGSTDPWDRQIKEGLSKALLGGAGLNAGMSLGRAGKGMPWPTTWAAIKAADPSAVMTSNFRAGARTAGYGNVSLHALGRAVDVVSPNMMATFLRIKGLRPWTELIYTPAGPLQERNGRNYWERNPRTMRDHIGHIHAAMEDGGILHALAHPKIADTGVTTLRPGYNVTYNGLGRPEHMVDVARLGPAPAAAPDFSVLSAAADKIMAAAQVMQSFPDRIEVPVRVGSREVARATREGEQSWGARSTWGHETTTLPGGGRL